eukprot:scaffold18336_cov79-Cyclotella_meneghiniana.AAC.4
MLRRPQNRGSREYLCLSLPFQETRRNRETLRYLLPLIRGMVPPERATSRHHTPPQPTTDPTAHSPPTAVQRPQPSLFCQHRPARHIRMHRHIDHRILFNNIQSNQPQLSSHLNQSNSTQQAENPNHHNAI